MCGDFNIPQAENHRHNVITFAQTMKLKSKPKLKKNFGGGSGKRWDQAERNLFENLKSVGMQDSIRKKHSYKIYEYSFAISWVFFESVDIIISFTYLDFFAASIVYPSWGLPFIKFDSPLTGIIATIFSFSASRIPCL